MRRRGLSLLEVVVAIAVLGLVLGLVTRNLRVGKLSGAAVEKLESIQDLRIGQRRLIQLLETATGVLYPAPGKSGPAVIVTDEVNRLHLIYLDGGGTLRVREPGEDSRVIVRGLQDFKATQAFSEELELVLAAASSGNGKPIRIVVSAHAGNHFHGETGIP